MTEYNQPYFNRRKNRQRSHSNICESCGNKLKYSDSWYCKVCKDK